MAAPISIQLIRGAIWLPELDLWLDPPRRSAKAFVSHAHGDHFARHEWTLCSEPTRHLISARYGAPKGEVVAPGWSEPLRWHGHEVRLLPAGHLLGSAMLHVTRLADGATLLYTGDFKLRPGRTSEVAELRRADVLVMETTFGQPFYRFPPAEVVAAGVQRFVREALTAGEVPVLLAYSLGKAQEALALLTGLERPVMLHEAVASMTKVYEQCGVRFPAWRLFSPRETAGHVVIFPPGVARRARQLERARLAMLSGWALNSGAKFRYQVAEAFPLSDHADYDELWETVRRVQPQTVYTVHGFTADFARDLRRKGIEAWSLRGGDQLELLMDEADGL